MNYVIEDNINFYDLLNNYNQDDTVKKEKCLISNLDLDENYITLVCGHKFNYYPLYQEIIRQKTIQNLCEVTKLKLNQIKCPYCRNITNNLLIIEWVSPNDNAIKNLDNAKQMKHIIHNGGPQNCRRSRRRCFRLARLAQLLQTTSGGYLFTLR